MNEFPLEIVTPIKLVDEGEVDYVRCPGLDGSFGEWQTIKMLLSH